MSLLPSRAEMIPDDLPRHEGRAALLREIFKGDDAAERFIVLRNGEALPERMVGTDLDVCIMPGRSLGEVAEFLIERGRSAGWAPVSVSRRSHMIGLSLVPLDEAADAVHFDVFGGITYLGLPMLRAETCAAESIVRHGVRSLNRRGQALATTVHHLAWNGYLSKEKYRAELAEVMSDPSSMLWMRESLAAAFGSRTLHAIDVAIAAGTLGRATARMRRAVRADLVARRALRRPATTMLQIVGYLAGQGESFRNPPGLIGTRGDSLPAAPRHRLTTELAGRIAPHGFGARSVRAGIGDVHTANGERYRHTLVRTWRRSTLLRWFLPSVFLYLQAKRGRTVVLERMPVALRALQRWSRPSWLAAPRAEHDA